MSIFLQKVINASRLCNLSAKCRNFKNVIEHNVNQFIYSHDHHSFEITDLNQRKQNMNKRFCGQWLHHPYKCLYIRQSHERCKKPELRFLQFALTMQVGF